MKETEVLQEVKSLLGANYKTEDEGVLKSIIKKVIMQAEYISNRIIYTAKDEVNEDNLKLLSPEIIDACVIAYQVRGVESVKSQSELGESNTFVDYTEKLRNDIIKDGKRIVM